MQTYLLNHNLDPLFARLSSSRGRIDAHCVTICSLINDRPEYYTTSSCSGRFHLYRGVGNKSDNLDTKKTLGVGGFDRFRISHGFISNEDAARRYFDLTTLDVDLEGGGDKIVDVKQYENLEGPVGEGHDEAGGAHPHTPLLPPPAPPSNSHPDIPDLCPDPSLVWLRYESFILHVNCVSLPSADALMSAARSAGYKTVGVQGCSARAGPKGHTVQVLGDEFLESPLFETRGKEVALAKVRARRGGRKRVGEAGKMDGVCVEVRSWCFYL